MCFHKKVVVVRYTPRRRRRAVSVIMTLRLYFVYVSLALMTMSLSIDYIYATAGNWSLREEEEEMLVSFLSNDLHFDVVVVDILDIFFFFFFEAVPSYTSNRERDYDWAMDSIKNAGRAPALPDR